MKILNSVKNTRHAKRELQHVFVDYENMVSTNVRTLVIKKHSLEITRPFYLMNKGEAGSCLEITKQIRYEYEIGTYPQYKRIIPTSPPIYFQNPIMGLNDTLDFLNQERSLNFDKDELKKIIKACDKTEFTHYMYQGIGVIAICNNIYTLLIMPF